MSILSESKYLDEITFSGGTIKDENCVDISDWTTDGDTGTGVSSQIIFDNKSCFKMDVVSAGGGNSASSTLVIGSFQTNPNVVSIKLYHDTLGTLAAVDYFELVLQATSYRCSIRWASDGLYIYDGASWNEVGTNLVQIDTWQEWTFSWTQQVAGVVDVYLNNVLQASAVDCSDSTAGTTGTTTMTQRGTTVIGLTYIDWFKAGNGFRYGGETWTIEEGGVLTVRTDTRWHANSPASMVGSFGNQTITDGEIIYDGRDVRWLAFDSGSSTVPAIGTSITQAGVSSSYLLGVYSSLTAAPTAVGASMPATGFIKFREVTGAFVAGALTGITASATGADVTGWIEVVADSASTITVPRFGTHTIRGDWFFLSDTTGAVGQVIQIPTNGGGASTYCPGVWIETDSSSNEYEYWPALNGSTNGWARAHLGAPYGATDRRQNFVKDIGSGQIQIGEASDLSATYANVAAQSSTYASTSYSCTYSWSGNVVTVYYSSGHLLKTGQQVYLDFTSGGATAYDGTYTITVTSAYFFTVPLAGSGSSGSVTARPGFTITFTSHSLGVGDSVYCDFTSGAGVDGSYSIYGVTGTGTYLIEAPHSSATSGNVSVYSRYEITYASHGLAIGNRVYLDFTSGAGVDGIYTIIEVPTSSTFRIVANNGASADSGNVTIKQTIGNIPASGCRVKIPNVFLRECATGTRASNMVNATIASRPEWATTTAGAIDIEYAYSTWYANLSQPYSVRSYHSSTYDQIIISECATALDLNDTHLSMYGALSIITLYLLSNFAGGTLSNIKAHRGNTPGSSDHAISVSYCKDLIFNSVTGGIIQFARSTGKGIQINYCFGLEYNNCRVFNSDFNINTSENITVNNIDTVDRYIGYTNATTAYYSVNIGTLSDNILVDGITFGFNGTIPNVHPYSGLCYIDSSSNMRIRNAGTFDNRLSFGNWRVNLYGGGYIYNSGGNNDTIKIQRCYVTDVRRGLISPINSDKNTVYESLYCGYYAEYSKGISIVTDASLNSIVKGCLAGTLAASGSSSVYGNSFKDLFMGDGRGLFQLAMNEPTEETDQYFTIVSGSARFNSSGGVLMAVVGDQAIWEDSCFRLGHTGFIDTAFVMSGGTSGNYNVEYQIDTGSGYGGSWKTLIGANLSAESVDPAIGFKMKIRVTTLIANTTAITFIGIYTTTTLAAQEDNLYPLDLVSVEVTVLDAVTKLPIANARVFLETDPGGVNLVNDVTDSNGILTFNVAYTSDQNIVGRVRKASADPFYRTGDIVGTITEDGFSTTVLLIED